MMPQNKQHFTDSPECGARAFCALCRDRSERGRRFRKNLARIFYLEKIDFECPHGVPWRGSRLIVVPQPVQGQASRGVGDTLAKLISRIGIKPCAGCLKRKERLNRRFPYKARR